MASFIGPLLAGLAGPAITGISSLISRKQRGGRIRRLRRRGRGVHSTGYIPSQKGVMFTSSKYLGSGLRNRRGGMVLKRKGYGLAVMHKWPLISRSKIYGIGGRVMVRRRLPPQPKLSSVMRGSGVVGLTHKVRGHMKRTAYGTHYVRPHYSINTSRLGYGLRRTRRRKRTYGGLVRVI